MWSSRTSDELTIEVWEKLDCESVGAAEIEAIQEALAGAFGANAVGSPMKIARLLADEGAVLRHPEILKLYVVQTLPRTSERELREMVDMTDLSSALRTIRILEAARADRNIAADKDGLRQLRELAIETKHRINEKIHSPRTDAAAKLMNIEMTEWLSHWIQVPNLFESWVTMRIESRDFISKFGPLDAKEDSNA